jgi:hypothetical protein
MGNEESFYQDVYVDHPGPDQRDTDPLEALLALCRLMGLRYQIKKVDDYQIKGTQYIAHVGWTDQPTDFYQPVSRDGVIGRYGKTPVDALRSAISDYVSILTKNANMFSMIYREDWKAKYGREWGKR